VTRLDEFLDPGTRNWAVLAGLVAASRAMDLGSTWIATPKLTLEGNPIARRLGWKWGIPLNLLLALGFATWPLLSISLITTSCLVAARNLQSAWVMRSMGELNYRCWMADRLAECPRGLAWGCFMGEALLVGAVGGILMAFSEWRLVPFSVGLGMAAYSFAVGLFSSIALWRSR